MAPDKFGVPASDLSDEDLERELRHLYETREETFFDGSASALRTHTDRMLELEHEYAARFPRETEPDPGRTRSGARARSG
jgi:uncharacterized protein DUF6158